MENMHKEVKAPIMETVVSEATEFVKRISVAQLGYIVLVASRMNQTEASELIGYLTN